MLKKTSSKVAQKYSICFFITAMNCSNGPIEEFMFQNVAYRPTVYKTGHCTTLTLSHKDNKRTHFIHSLAIKSLGKNTELPNHQQDSKLLASFVYVVAGTFVFFLAGAEQPINQFKLDQQSRQQALRAPCHIYCGRVTQWWFSSTYFFTIVCFDSSVKRTFKKKGCMFQQDIFALLGIQIFLIPFVLSQGIISNIQFALIFDIGRKLIFMFQQINMLFIVLSFLVAFQVVQSTYF